MVFVFVDNHISLIHVLLKEVSFYPGVNDTEAGFKLGSYVTQ